MGKMKRLWVWLQENSDSDEAKKIINKLKQKGDNGNNIIHNSNTNNNKHHNRDMGDINDTV